MKFVADEGVDGQIVETLRADGHFDVLYFAEIGSGTDDGLILHYANNQDRILMTRDKDFGELVFQKRQVHSGIILNRLYELTSATKAEIVSEVISRYGEELYGSFTVIQPGKVRIKKIK